MSRLVTELTTFLKLLFLATGLVLLLLLSLLLLLLLLLLLFLTEHMYIRTWTTPFGDFYLINSNISCI